MKNVRFALLFLCTCWLASCSKSTDEIKTESALIGKWSLKREISTRVNGAYSQKDTGYFDPGEYLQFVSGGQLIARVDNQTSQSYWKLLDENKTLWIEDNGSLDVPENGYEIKTLNSTNLILYAKEGTSANYYDVTIYLEK